MPCLRRIACPSWRHIAGDTAQGGGASPFFFLSRECSLDATGLLRFRTGDVLLGTSGVGCAYLWCLIPPVFIFLCYIGHHVYDLLSHEPISGRRPPPRAVKVAGSKPATCFDPYTIFFSPGRARFCSRCLLDSIQRSQAVAWCVSRFRHGSDTSTPNLDTDSTP